MSQHDFDIANQGFAAFRADLNNALKALGSLSSGTAEPATTYANQLWYETDTNILHIRNEANSAWLDLMVIDQTTGSPSFTAGNVGIGTSSPDFPLDVSSTGVGSTIVSRFYVTDNTVGLLRVGNSTTGDGSTAPAFGANGTSAVVHTNNAERMRLDASGNLGLGVTPSAWSRKALQIGDAAAAYVANGSGGATVIATNMFFDGANKYATTAAAARYSVGTGTHEWYTAPSGTAGNAITFTQAMTLDASGNLGIGTSSPSYALSVARNSSSELAIQAVNAGIGQATLRLQNSLRHWAIFVDDGASGPLRFYDYTAAAERARITDAGTLLIGRTANVSATTRLGLDTTASIAGFVSETGVSTATTHARFYNPNGNVGNISTNASATTYSTSSDYRLKENVAPMQNALDTVAQLNPVTYTWKADGSAGQGFIAHELQAVVPDCVTGEKDAVDAEGNPQYQGVDTSFLVATLVKAIQELTARVAQLEAK